MKLDLKLYRGYANEKELVVYGHVFKARGRGDYAYDKKKLKHALTIIQMFRVKPMDNVEVELRFEDLTVRTRTMHDGYFRFSIPFVKPIKSGWHTYTVTGFHEGDATTGEGELLKPYESKVSIISDIDDTFLVSHSNNFFKKIYVMLTRNVNRRKTFDDVVEHYRQLSIAGQDAKEASNSFFYVSSSEWNLYGFIVRFAQENKLPKAVIKLKKLKTGLRDFVKTGRGDHDHKFDKIQDIIDFCPSIDYVLLGDDSQQDPDIYERICKTFPMNIRAVYIRQTGHHKKERVGEILKNINTLDVHTCYFKKSTKALRHSKQIGIIN